jgi:hypothetical protein
MNFVKNTLMKATAIFFAKDGVPLTLQWKANSVTDFSLKCSVLLLHEAGYKYTSFTTNICKFRMYFSPSFFLLCTTYFRNPTKILQVTILFYRMWEKQFEKLTVCSSVISFLLFYKIEIMVMYIYLFIIRMFVCL